VSAARSRPGGCGLDAPIDNHGANDAQNEHDDAPPAHWLRLKPGPVSTRLGAQAKPPDGVWCGAMRRLDARMEKAPEPSHARMGEELPSARWQYTILILHKILIYANVRSRTASFGMRPCSGPGLLLSDRSAGRDRYSVARGSGPRRQDADGSRGVPEQEGSACDSSSAATAGAHNLRDPSTGPSDPDAADKLAASRPAFCCCKPILDEAR
jgi:hypothetical protein